MPPELVKQKQLSRTSPALKSPIDRLYSQIQGTLLHMSSPDTLYAVMGAVAANMLEGPAVWLLFIGPPGSGKSALLDSLSKLAKVEFVSSITGEQAYLSGTPNKKREPGATGGLLHLIGAHGLIVTDDITGLLELHNHQRQQILACERKIFDGKFDRAMGVDGGRKLFWEGKIGKIGGVTGAIDHYCAISSSLGERWVYYRWPPPIHDWYEMAKFVADNAKTKRARSKALAEAVLAMFDEVGIHFGEETEPVRPPNLAETSRIIDMAKLAVQCRTAVSRDHAGFILSHRTRDTESPNRLVGILIQLFSGMSEIGVPLEAIWRIIGRCALHSMAAIRLDIVLEIYKRGSVEYTHMQFVTGMSRSTVVRAVEDLAYNGVVSVPDPQVGVPNLVILTDHTRNLLDRFFREITSESITE